MKSKLIFSLVLTLFAGLAGVMVWRHRVNTANRETVTKTVFEPYFAAARLEDSYENFTDDYYKSVFALDDYLAAHAETIAKNGRLLGYELRSVQDCSEMFSRRSTVCVLLVLKFERGSEKLMHYQIRQGADDQFRVRYSGTYDNQRVEAFPF